MLSSNLCQRSRGNATCHTRGRGNFSQAQCVAARLCHGAALLAIATAPAHAQSTVIAACDEFLTKYDACVTSKLPEAQRATYKAQLDQTRKTWVDMSKNPATKSTMEATCKQTMDAMKTALQGYGCSF